MFRTERKKNRISPVPLFSGIMNREDRLPPHGSRQKELTLLSGWLTGEYPAIPALQGRVKGYNIEETPCRKAPPFRKALQIHHEIEYWMITTPIK